MSIRSAVKNQLPSALKPKTGIRGKPQTEQLDQSGGCLVAQAESPVGAQIATEALALKASRDTLVLKDGELAKLFAEYSTKQLEVVIAEDEHATALETYSRRAAVIAKGDLAVLKGLGVEALATQRSPRAEGPAAMPSNLRVLPGEDSGSVIVKWSRPRRAGAFLAQCKLEPQSADAPPSDWFPAEGFATRNIQWSLNNLPPAAQVRVRVRAIGAVIGPWSEEALGRAR